MCGNLCAVGESGLGTPDCAPALPIMRILHMHPRPSLVCLVESCERLHAQQSLPAWRRPTPARTALPSPTPTPTSMWRCSHGRAASLSAIPTHLLQPLLPLLQPWVPADHHRCLPGSPLHAPLSARTRALDSSRSFVNTFSRRASLALSVVPAAVEGHGMTWGRELERLCLPPLLELCALSTGARARPWLACLPQSGGARAGGRRGLPGGMSSCLPVQGIPPTPPSLTHVPNHPRGLQVQGLRRRAPPTMGQLSGLRTAIGRAAHLVCGVYKSGVLFAINNGMKARWRDTRPGWLLPGFGRLEGGGHDGTPGCCLGLKGERAPSPLRHCLSPATAMACHSLSSSRSTAALGVSVSDHHPQHWGPPRAPSHATAAHLP